jgi:hypothetical protein
LTLITQDGLVDSPFAYQLAPNESWTPLSVSAIFDGSAAGAEFLPCLSFYAQSGELIARTFPADAQEVGDVAEVTFAPFLREQTSGTPTPATSAIYPGNPVAIPLLVTEGGPFDGLNFTTVTVDARVRGNAYYANAVGIGDYFTRKVSIGPKGSIWGIGYSYAAAPDGGQFVIDLASVASPNPNRGGFDAAGTLTDAALSYHQLSGVQDTYAAAFGDANHNGYFGFRLGGNDGAPFTGFTGNDPYTGIPRIDGGAGVYSLRIRVTGQNGASAGAICRLTNLVAWRVDDLGFI